MSLNKADCYDVYAMFMCESEQGRLRCNFAILVQRHGDRQMALSSSGRQLQEESYHFQSGTIFVLNDASKTFHPNSFNGQVNNLRVIKVQIEFTKWFDTSYSGV